MINERVLPSLFRPPYRAQRNQIAPEVDLGEVTKDSEADGESEVALNYLRATNGATPNT